MKKAAFLALAFVVALGTFGMSDLQAQATDPDPYADTNGDDGFDWGLLGLLGLAGLLGLRRPERYETRTTSAGDTRTTARP